MARGGRSRARIWIHRANGNDIWNYPIRSLREIQSAIVLQFANRDALTVNEEMFFDFIVPITDVDRSANFNETLNSMHHVDSAR